ncbi:unnamed protein product [Phytophthora lilii]|uniref:Unnamed protein product n=1 Tax=Phytophthora lilii TaxID=2077276 RepID=A0A9W6XBF8_9STRA|nr:unnamed protein product [Phytophthora lilii]
MPVPFQNGALLNLSAQAVNFGRNRAGSDDYDEQSEADDIAMAADVDVSELSTRTLIREVIRSSLLDPIVDIRRDEALRNNLEHSLLRLVDRATLDPGQLKSFAEALMYPVHCTQGPPGTGKLYLGVVVVRALLIVRDLWKEEESRSRRSSILVFSYKNYAIDEFLLDLLRSEPMLDHTPSARSYFNKYYQRNSSKQLVRIGGGCSEPELEQYRERNVAFSDPKVCAVSQRIEDCQELREEWHKFRDHFSPFVEAQTIVAGDTKSLSAEDWKVVQGAVPAASSAVAILLALTESMNTCDGDALLAADDMKEKNQATEEYEEEKCSSSDELLNEAPTIIGHPNLSSIDALRFALKNKLMVTNADIHGLYEGVKHYDLDIHPSEVLYRWMAGFCPLPACAHPDSCLKVCIDDSRFCQDHSCRYTQNEEDFVWTV